VEDISRFLISHKLLIDETYTAPLRDWLETLRPGTLLILDEAHHAAPSSVLDSHRFRFTRAIRDMPGASNIVYFCRQLRIMAFQQLQLPAESA